MEGHAADLDKIPIARLGLARLRCVERDVRLRIRLSDKTQIFALERLWIRIAEIEGYHESGDEDLGTRRT
jgi:hypothetical protein